MNTFLHQIEQLAAQHPAYINLLPLPGIGPMIASAYIAAIGIDRQGFNKGVVELANKLARISWVIVTTGEPFDVKQAFKSAA